MVKAQVQITFRLPVEIRKKGRWFMASCRVLDVVTQGESAAKARANLIEALGEFFLSCCERGTLDEVMKQAGFIPSAEHEWGTPFTIEGDYVTVPLPFVIAETAQHARAG